MRILLLSSTFPKEEKSANIYTDLAVALTQHGHRLTVVVSEEKKNVKDDSKSIERDMEVLRVKCGNIYEVNFIEKTISFLTIGFSLIKAIKKNYSNEEFDLILFSSPPVTLNRVVKWCMKKYKCDSYLMMKDIFPQNGLDIGLYTKMNPMYWYFKFQETKLYEISTTIGCMSPKNIEYLNIQSRVPLDKLELFPNSVKIRDFNNISEFKKKQIRQSYGIKKTDIVSVFGGNFGKPQGLDFLEEVLIKYRDKDDCKFLLVGNGTEKDRLFKFIDQKRLTNVLKFDYMQREEFEKLLSACDIGMVFLDKRFTVPNFPSKTLSYFECALPIIAAVDDATDYGDIIEKIDAGFKVKHGNINDFAKKFNKLVINKERRNDMGNNGRKYYEKECNVENCVKIIEKRNINV